MSEFFLARTRKKGQGTLTFEGVVPADPGESFDSLEKAIKVIEESSDPRGLLVIEVFLPRVEVKVTLGDEAHEVEAAKKA